MKADYIYFGSAGLTSASANHVANMAKESIMEISRRLEAIGFYDATVCLLSGGTPQQCVVGSKRDDLDEIMPSLERIGEANALIAWLREAIKARERLLQEVKDMSLECYCKEVLHGADVPKHDTNIGQWMKDKGYQKPDINGEFPGVQNLHVLGTATNRIELMCRKFGISMPEEPKVYVPMTEDEYMATLSIKDRNRILMLNAKAAAIGKCIHENGPLSKARAELQHVLSFPTETKGEGAGMVIYRLQPSVETGEVEALFFRLNAEYRALQAELNGLLAERDRAIEADKQAKAAAWQEDSARYSREMSVLQDKLSAYLAGERERMSKLQEEYDAWSAEQTLRHQQLCADMAAWKLQESERIASLGIVIPNDLRAVYDRVNGLGK